jgi:3-methyladenine DNA glycosylase AlkD
MAIITSAHARELGNLLALEVASRLPAESYAFLAPILAERTPFRFLDLIGESLALCPVDMLDPFLDEIASHATIGGWTVIASALRPRIQDDLAGTLEKTIRFIIRADTWYACDCFGERVLGQALVDTFSRSLPLLSPCRMDVNRWVRRSVGVAGHFWAKRAKGSEQSLAQAAELLDFYTPMLEDHQIDAAKGVGWAFKTMGRYYPDLVVYFLADHEDGAIAAVIRRKALKFLPEKMKAKLKQ